MLKFIICTKIKAAKDNSLIRKKIQIFHCVQLNHFDLNPSQEDLYHRHIHRVAAVWKLDTQFFFCSDYMLLHSFWLLLHSIIFIFNLLSIIGRAVTIKMVHKEGNCHQDHAQDVQKGLLFSLHILRKLTPPPNLLINLIHLRAILTKILVCIAKKRKQTSKSAYLIGSSSSSLLAYHLVNLHLITYLLLEEF